MFLKYINLFLIIIFFYQVPLYSKNKELKDFNSNYFSGVVAYKNKNNSDALKFFRSSKILLNKHDPYFEKYIHALVSEGKVKQAANEIKQNLKKNNSRFFEAHLILAMESLKKKNFEKSKLHLQQSKKFINNNRVSLFIYESIKQYIYTFQENKILESQMNFGDLSLINKIFQKCYLDNKDTIVYFRSLLNNSSDTDYSRYTFFLINYLIEDNKFSEAQKITNQIDYLNSSPLISQAKKWVEEKKFDELKKVFSCKNPDDVVSEFLFLIANLYSSQNDYDKANFYFNISHYLNPKFKFNLTLLAENYFLIDNYEKVKKTLEYFNVKDEFYYWFKVKKQAQIISMEKNDEKSLNFITKKYKKIESPSVKIIFDMANFNKNSKKYKNAITYYDQIISLTDPNSLNYANLLYRRGSSYERLGNYLKSDKDFLNSLEINPDDAYVLNYLAYSWLEREYKIDESIQMLEKAYALRSNDPYIIDSVGWAHYLIDDFLKAEKFLKRAVELMPNDPVVNDHYGDILWKLGKKIQARYFWKSVLNLKETEDKMKKNINIKLIEGLKKS
jgi:tetratricopeptide (TPR) repeat protein